MMKKQILLTLALAFTCLFLSASPAFAGEWIETEDKQSQYIDDEGELIYGWLDLDNNRYYFDREGYLVCGRWSKISRYWYYFDENGTLVTNTWVDNYHVNDEGQKDRSR